MGVWGPGLFADDLALDVRDLYRDLIGDDHSADYAKEAILREWHEICDDPDAGPAFWLALAITQWKLGRLDENTKERALALIRSGAALRPWLHEKSLRQRQRVLDQAAIQLQSPQPAPRKLRKRFKNSCEWETGELIEYVTRSGRSLIFRVIGHHSDQGGTAPIVEVLDWIGGVTPTAEELQLIPIRSGMLWEGLVGVFPSHNTTQILIGRLKESELPRDRVRRLGIKSKPTQKVGGFVCAGWKTLDEQLEMIFEIKLS
jgi:hypothetical protein